MGKVWDGRLEDLVTAHGHRMLGLAWTAERGREKAQEAVESLQRVETEIALEQKKFAEGFELLQGRKQDPEVIVRDYNVPTIYAYHADVRCPKVNEQRSRKILLSEATGRRYRPCRFCGYRVPREKITDQG